MVDHIAGRQTGKQTASLHAGCIAPQITENSGRNCILKSAFVGAKRTGNGRIKKCEFHSRAWRRYPLLLPLPVLAWSWPVILRFSFCTA